MRVLPPQDGAQAFDGRQALDLARRSLLALRDSGMQLECARTQTGRDPAELSSVSAPWTLKLGLKIELVSPKARS